MSVLLREPELKRSFEGVIDIEGVRVKDRVGVKTVKVAVSPCRSRVGDSEIVGVSEMRKSFAGVPESVGCVGVWCKYENVSVCEGSNNSLKP